MAGTVIEPAAGRRVQRRKRRENAFTDARKTMFLECLCATANAAAAARAAGVGKSTPFMARMNDAMFRERWEEALEQGYARLEGELMRQAIIAANPPRLRGDAAAAPVDPTLGLQLLKLRQSRAAGRMGRPVERSDIEDARARLEKKMRAVGLIVDHREDVDGGG